METATLFVLGVFVGVIGTTAWDKMNDDLKGYVNIIVGIIVAVISAIATAVLLFGDK